MLTIVLLLGGYDYADINYVDIVLTTVLMLCCIMGVKQKVESF